MQGERDSSRREDRKLTAGERSQEREASRDIGKVQEIQGMLRGRGIEMRETESMRMRGGSTGEQMHKRKGTCDRQRDKAHASERNDTPEGHKTGLGEKERQKQQEKEGQGCQGR